MHRALVIALLVLPLAGCLETPSSFTATGTGASTVTCPPGEAMTGLESTGAPLCGRPWAPTTNGSASEEQPAAPTGAAPAPSPRAVGDTITRTHLSARLDNITAKTLDNGARVVDLTWTITYTENAPAEGLRIEFGVRGLTQWGEERGRPAALTFRMGEAEYLSHIAHGNRVAYVHTTLGWRESYEWTASPPSEAV